MTATCDLVYNNGISCEVTDDQMSVTADLGATRGIGPDIWLVLEFEASAQANHIEFIAGAGAFTSRPDQVTFTGDAQIEMSREGNTITGTGLMLNAGAT